MHDLKHYEIVFLVHPDQSEQVVAMIQRYTSLVLEQQGQVHRVEDWGRRQLAYPIHKITKAHYVLMNVALNNSALQEIKDAFRYNDAVMRSLILRVKQPISEASVFLKEREQRGQDGMPGDNQHTNKKAPIAEA
jgi:small subunit ribosomal protein S6